MKRRFATTNLQGSCGYQGTGERTRSEESGRPVGAVRACARWARYKTSELVRFGEKHALDPQTLFEVEVEGPHGELRSHARERDRA